MVWPRSGITQPVELHELYWEQCSVRIWTVAIYIYVFQALSLHKTPVPNPTPKKNPYTKKAPPTREPQHGKILYHIVVGLVVVRLCWPAVVLRVLDDWKIVCPGESEELVDDN